MKIFKRLLEDKIRQALKTKRHSSSEFYPVGRVPILDSHIRGRKMRKVESMLMRIMGKLIAGLIFIMMLDIFAEVVARYVLHGALNFSEELGRYLFVWIVFIGMARCVGNDKHVALDLLINSVHGRSKRILCIFIYCVEMIFFAAMSVGGVLLCFLGSHQRSATMRIPMNYVYLCIPVCGCISLFFLSRKVWETVQDWGDNK